MRTNIARSTKQPWHRPQLATLRALDARMPDACIGNEGQSGKAFKIRCSPS